MDILGVAASEEPNEKSKTTAKSKATKNEVKSDEKKRDFESN